MKTAMTIGFVIMFLMAGTSLAGLNDGLVAYYPFNGNANDESGNGNNGIVNGATLTTDRFGNANKSYSFNGVNSYIKIENSVSLQPISVTLAGWFYFSSIPSRITTLIEKALGSGVYDSYAIWYEPGQLHGHIADNGGDGPILAYSFNPTLETWYHIVYTFDDVNNKQFLYVNGNVVASGEVNKSIAYDSHPVIIGGDTENETLSFLFPGKIDDIRIYNRSLSQSEIQQLYQQSICSDVVVKPYTFTAGTPARASEVNANFDILYQQLNALSCQVQSLKAIVCADHPQADICK